MRVMYSWDGAMEVRLIGAAQARPLYTTMYGNDCMLFDPSNVTPYTLGPPSPASKFRALSTN